MDFENAKVSADAVTTSTERDVESSDQIAFASKLAPAPAFWQMGSRRLSKTLSRHLFADDLLGEASGDGTQVYAGTSRKHQRWAVVIAVLVCAALATAVLPRRWGSTSQHNGAPGVAQYLRGIAKWYEGAKSGMALHSMHDATLRSCAKQIQLPEIQLPKQLPAARSWQPDGVYPENPLDGLSLNCSTLKDLRACDAAADSSNAYEGDLLPLSAEDLAAHLQPIEVHKALETTELDPDQDVSSLALNCEEDPAACIAAAEHSNTYADDAASTDAAAEAAAYLLAAQAPSGWATVISQPRDSTASDSDAQQEQEGQAPNSYEGIEEPWQQLRIAEEAGAQYMDSSELDLDCSKEEIDAMVADECERSRAVNRYEAPAPVAVQNACSESKLRIQFQRTQHSMRTVGYDVPAVEWEQYLQRQDNAVDSTAPSGCSEEASEEREAASETTEVTDPAVSSARLQEIQQQLQEIVKQRRVTGYDVPALDEQQEWLAMHAAQHAEPVVAVVADPATELLQARKYFKCPCNDPDAHDYFHNKFNHPGGQVYYKNPANAPAHFDEGELQGAPAPSSATAQQTFVVIRDAMFNTLKSAAAAVSPYFRVLVALAAVALGSLYARAPQGYLRRPARAHALAPALRSKRNVSAFAMPPTAAGRASDDSEGTGAIQHSRSNAAARRQSISTSLSIQKSNRMASMLPSPYLYTTASTIHDAAYDAILEETVGELQESSMMTRVSQFDDIPDPSMDSPHASPSHVLKKME